MPNIKIQTEIQANKEIVFDLSRSADFPKKSNAKTKQIAIAGKTSGLIELNERVTWRAKHLGFYMNLTSKITEFDRPNYFVDEMQNGAFREFRHEHHFEDSNDGTLMTDYFNYKSPFGILGEFVDKIFLENYVTNLLIERNNSIKKFAESDKWKEVLKN